MTPEQLKAVAITLELVRKHPPSGESWDRPGTPTLEDQMRKWLKEQL